MTYVTGWIIRLNPLVPKKVHLIGWCNHCKLFAIMYEDGRVARTHQKYLELDYD